MSKNEETENETETENESNDYLDMKPQKLETCAVALGKLENGNSPDVWHIEYGHYTSACSDENLTLEGDDWIPDMEDWIDVRFREDVCFECRAIMAMTFEDASEIFVTYWRKIYEEKAERENQRREADLKAMITIAANKDAPLFREATDKFSVEYKPRKTEVRRKGKQERGKQ